MRARGCHRRPSFAIVGACLLLVGCAPPRLLPLAVGQHWDYRVRSGVERDVARVEVAREAPVAGGTGWELRGPMGVSRLGYQGERLVAEGLGGAFVRPPLPIGIPVKTQALWRGWVLTPKGELPAKATVVAREAKLTVRGRPQTLNRTVVTMRVGGRTVELSTWYAPGEAIVQQEQRTDERLDLSLERVGG